jgi:beta-lactamase class A
VAYDRRVLSAPGRLRPGWLVGGALLVTLFGTAGAAMWTATPLPSSGQLVDAAGHPVGDAVISETSTLFSPAAQVRSDPHGRYQIGARRWPYSPPKLTVRAPGFVPVATAGGRLVMHHWPQLSGVVADDAGAQLAGAVVTLAHLSDVVDAVMTNLDGRFEMTLQNVLGDVTVTALSDEHDAGSQQVTLALDGTPRIKLTLLRHFARLHVDSDPAGQAPQVDGQPSADCQSTPCDLTVLAGAHQVAFVTDLFVPWQTEVQVGKDDAVTVRAQLERKTGTLNINAPGGGELALDGQGLSSTPFSGKIPTGQHTVSWRSATTWPAAAQANVNWNQTTDVTLTPTSVGHDANAFTNGLKDYLNAQGGTFGVYLEGLRSGVTVAVGDTIRLEAASVIKMPEALYLLHQSDSGQISFADQIDLHPEDFMSGTGSLIYTAHPGDMFSYDQLLSLLIQQSDNTAWRALRRVFGDSQIDAYAASIGAGDCQQVTNACSARSAGRMMAQLARGELLNQTSTQRLLNLLETTQFNDWLPYYIGRTAAVAHKIGTDPDNGVANDCGVIFLSGDPFAICVFTTTPGQSGARVIRDIARAALNLY